MAAETIASPARSARPVRIFISAAELSGDRHAAELIREIRRLRPGTEFWGIAGPAMQAAGCELVEDFTARATMLVGAVGLAGHAWRLIRRVRRLVGHQRSDLAILVDSPALHLPMAKQLRAAGVPVLYYIAPQLWAWAPWRIRKVRRRVDRMSVILPFEEDYFRRRGMAADFAGHPLVTQLSALSPSPEIVASLKEGGRPLIACLPGSRRHVIKEVLPGQIEVARAIAEQYPQARFVFAAASDAAAERMRSALAGERFSYRLERNRNAEILTAADLALVASGTMTLETAWYGVPMIVMYNGSKWGYRLVGRWLIRAKYLSLVNILAGRRIVPEFMPYYTSTEPIAAEALDILNSPQRQATIKADLKAVIDSLGNHNAAERTAQIALEMASQSHA